MKTNTVTVKKPSSNLFRIVWRILLFSFLILSYALLNYTFFGGWFYSSFGTVAIVVISYFLWKKNYLRFTGLKMNLKIVVKSLLLAILLSGANYWIINYIADNHGVLLEWSNWRSYFHIFFYTLNEEIMIGALPLLAIVRSRKVTRLQATVGLALLFSIMHFVFYKWVFNDRGVIELMTLATLFLIGVVRNDLILSTGHIGYSWALHFSWVAVMFGTQHIYGASNSGLGELARFNLYLGSPEMLIVSGVLVGIVALRWSKSKIRKRTLV